MDEIREDYLRYVNTRAIEYFGDKNQRIKAMEELSELIQAIARDLNGLDNNVEEELADVEIMIHQLRFIYDHKKIDKIKAEKLERLELMCLEL